MKTHQNGSTLRRSAAVCLHSTVQKCCKRYSKQRDNISACSMEVGVLEVWNDIYTESESEVSNEECEDDLVIQECIGIFIRKREHHPAIICGWSQ